MDKGDLLVLHAAIAVALHRVKTDEVYPNTQNAERQARTSRELVIKHAMSEMSLQSLMALVILVFCDVSTVCLVNAQANI